MKSIKQIALENLARKAVKLDSAFRRCPTKKSRKAFEKAMNRYKDKNDTKKKYLVYRLRAYEFIRNK